MKGLQRQIDTLRRQMVEEQEATRRDMNRQLEAQNRELEALRTQVRMLTDKLGAKEGLVTQTGEIAGAQGESAPVTLLWA